MWCPMQAGTSTVKFVLLLKIMKHYEHIKNQYIAFLLIYSMCLHACLSFLGDLTMCLDIIASLTHILYILTKTQMLYNQATPYTQCGDALNLHCMLCNIQSLLYMLCVYFLANFQLFYMKCYHMYVCTVYCYNFIYHYLYDLIDLLQSRGSSSDLPDYPPPLQKIGQFLCFMLRQSCSAMHSIGSEFIIQYSSLYM